MAPMHLLQPSKFFHSKKFIYTLLARNSSIEDMETIQSNFELFEELNFLELKIERQNLHIQIAKTKLKEGEIVFRNNEEHTAKCGKQNDNEKCMP